MTLTTEQLICQVPLFTALPPDELAYLAGHLRLVELPAGDVLFREGESTDHFYLLLEGRVGIVKSLGTSDERLLAQRGTGTLIGELSMFIHGGQHTATVLAHTPLRLLQMTLAEFDALLHRHPGLAYAMVGTLSQRLNEAENHTIRDLREKNQALSDAYQALAAAQAQIIEQERLERELEVARSIQRSLLPRTLPSLPDYDFGALMQPMSAVGGDFYDLLDLGAGRLGIAVGDVSDHGVGAALFMAITVTLLRAEARRDAAPGDVLRRVNRQLLEVNDPGMFVTVLYGVLDLASGSFTYGRAGHERPVIYAGPGQLRHPPRARGGLLGIADDPPIDEQQVTLEPGGLLLLFTDGVVEATDPGGALFGPAGLQAALDTQPGAPAQAVCDRVLACVGAYRGQASQQDDITLVAVKAA